jgi:hypothetical protein
MFYGMQRAIAMDDGQVCAKDGLYESTKETVISMTL